MHIRSDLLCYCNDSLFPGVDVFLSSAPSLCQSHQFTVPARKAFYGQCSGIKWSIPEGWMLCWDMDHRGQESCPKECLSCERVFLDFRQILRCGWCYRQWHKLCSFILIKNSTKDVKVLHCNSRKFRKTVWRYLKPVFQPAMFSSL